MASAKGLGFLSGWLSLVNQRVSLVDFLALRRPRISPPPSLFLVELAGAIKVVSIDCALLHGHTVGFEMCFHIFKGMFTQVVFIQG